MGKPIRDSTKRFIRNSNYHLRVCPFSFYPEHALGLVASIVLIDFGVFSAQVANQVRVFSIDAQAQSRVNSIYMLGYYIGGAVESSAGVKLYSQFGWNGVSTIACGVLLISLTINRTN